MAIPATAGARRRALPARPWRHGTGLGAVLLAALMGTTPSNAQAGASAEPLTVEEALSLAKGHPRTQTAAPGSRQADGAASWVPPRRLPLYLACHELAFGAGAGAGAGGAAGRERALDALLDPVEAQRLEILERFLDVLLADQGFARYSEAMAVAYVQLDRASVRRELGQVGDLRVAELDATYQDVRQRRAGSEAAQRLTRALLAQAMDSPEVLPRDLTAPELPALPDAPPALDAVVAAAQADNRALAALKDGATPAAARLVDLELRQQAVELLMRLQALDASVDSSRAQAALSDLKLEESRVLYEQEASADLGYSMSQQTKARLDEQRVGYCRVLAWAELQGLQGRPVWPLNLKGESP